MTDQINREFIPAINPEVEPVVHGGPNHRLRSFLAKSAIVACGMLGAATSLMSQQPSAERTIGPVSIDTEVALGPEVQILGLTAAESEYGIGMDIDFKLPEIKEIPDISRRLAPITQEIASNQNDATILSLIQEEYAPEIDSMKDELIRESLLYLGVGALAGSFLSAKIIEKLGQDRRSWKFIVASSMAGMLVVGAAEFQSLGSINTEKAAERLGQELRQPFDEYLLTSTSDMLVNLDSINAETQKQIARLVHISGALTKQQPEISENEQTWVIYSDSHGLPTAPETIETLAQSANADAIVGAGDYGNTGSEFEMDLMDGLSLNETTFRGFDDMRACDNWNESSNTCTKRGELLPHGALSDNHDPTDIVSLFTDLNMTSLDRARVFNGIPVYALSGACHADTVGCRDDDAKIVNQELAQEQLAILETSGEPMPKIGIFASYDAAEIFFGKIDTLFVGGKHEFSHVTKKGSDVYYLPTVGQAFPRGAKEAGAVVISINNDGALLQCRNVSWQALRVESPTITAC